MFIPRSHSTSKCRKQRAGTSAVEFALCAPILLAVFLGSIEICNVIFAKQAATAACYEAVRIASNTGGTKAAAITRAEEVLAARSLTGASIVFVPDSEAAWDRGVEIRVTVTLPVNSTNTMKFFTSTSIGANLTMVRE